MYRNPPELGRILITWGYHPWPTGGICSSNCPSKEKGIVLLQAPHQRARSLLWNMRRASMSWLHCSHSPDHQYDLVTDAFQKHKDVLVASLQPVEQQLDTVTKSLQQLDTQCQQITDQRETLVGNVHKTIQEPQEALEVRKTQSSLAS